MINFNSSSAVKKVAAVALVASLCATSWFAGAYDMHLFKCVTCNEWHFRCYSKSELLEEKRYDFNFASKLAEKAMQELNACIGHDTLVHIDCDWPVLDGDYELLNNQLDTLYWLENQ